MAVDALASSGCLGCSCFIGLGLYDSPDVSLNCKITTYCVYSTSTFTGVLYQAAFPQASALGGRNRAAVSTVGGDINMSLRASCVMVSSIGCKIRWIDTSR